MKKGRIPIIVINDLPLSVLQLIRELGNINVKKKEPPFCYPYSLKAKVLVLAHLARMDVSEELEEGRTCKFYTAGIIVCKDYKKKIIKNIILPSVTIFLQNAAKGAGK